MAGKRQIRNAKTAISPELKEFFGSGTIGNQTEGDADVFILANSDQKMKEVWKEYTDTFMADWQREKRQGRPWIEGYLRSCGLLKR